MTSILPSAEPSSPPARAWIEWHQQSLWRFLRFLGCEPDLADDLAQDALVVALEHRVERMPAAQGAAWLRTTARRLWIDEMRRRKRRPLPASLEHVDPDLLERVWARCEGDDQGESYRVALNLCLGEVEPRQRRVLELRYGERASREAIAAELGLGEEGVKAMLRRVRERLRICIGKRRGR